MKFKVGDVVKVKSVSGHSDIINAIGMIGVVEVVDDIGCGVKKNYYINVKYAFPIQCACKKCKKLPDEKKDYWHREKFAEDELELVR